ncbi:MAG: cbb3-type cytochrome c oxidase subunit I [Balneolaceae bacterium]|nr:cbb3-type cytochrome c oxidase subunit I [Balneolaceae bacterium]
MPAPSRWMIRLALIYLLAGMAMGAMLLIHKAYPITPAVWMLLPIHIEVTIFGWIIQLTLGTAYWMLPRYIEGPPRGRPLLAAGMVLALNLGILLVIIDTLIMVSFPLQLTGRMLELMAVGLFIFLHWNRIVTYRTKKA